VLILTARGEDTDIRKGVKAGADDYTVKPFRQMELLARVKVLALRSSPREKGPPMICGLIYFHPPARQLLYRGKPIQITATEADILYELMKDVGRVVTYSTLAQAVWGGEYPGAADSLKVHVDRLRGKIEADPGCPQLIIGRPGTGYVMVGPECSCQANSVPSVRSCVDGERLKITSQSQTQAAPAVGPASFSDYMEEMEEMPFRIPRPRSNASENRDWT
ncbi:MAG: response regulator transcription factor, partial [Chloroflexi bacterium]|nr:response regulator transcription factor [Chloroflexota bacterium]